MSTLNVNTLDSEDGNGIQLAKAIEEAEGTQVASAGTTDIWVVDGNTVHVTGTTTITSLGTAPKIGAWRKVIFDGILTLTDGANLNVPGGANITTAADDFAMVYAETTTLFKVLYFRADGTALVGGGSSAGAMNELINGEFNISQIITTFTSGTVPKNDDDTVLLDRWNNLSDGNDITDHSQESSNVFTGYKTSINIDVETASKKFGVCQIIEGSRAEHLIGGVASLSFTAKVNNAGAGRLDNIKAVVLAWDGTLDVPTTDLVSSWNAEDTTPTWATNWTQENVPANLNVLTTEARYTIENISIDTASAKNLAVFIWADGLTGTVTDTLKITAVQLEKGATAGDFETRDITTEFILATRFRYIAGIDTNQFWLAGSGQGTVGVSCGCPLPAPMRISPSITALSGTSTSASTAGGSATASSISITNISGGHLGAFISFKLNNYTGITDNRPVIIHLANGGFVFNALLG